MNSQSSSCWIGMRTLHHRKKRVALTLLLASSTLLAGCGPLSDLLLDCVDDDGPILRPRVIPNPVLNQTYDVTITASIENEPFDDSFNYDLRVSRTLPEGLIADVFERQVRISGAATELGDFTIDVGVTVNDPGFNSLTFNNSLNNTQSSNTTSSNLCRTTAQRSYAISIQPDA